MYVWYVYSVIQEVLSKKFNKKTVFTWEKH